jgi:S-adenosylmethionine:tRNA ribosyltransferase-isomerase
MRTELFEYQLPKKYIAQRPLPKRENSKLLVLDRKNGSIKHDAFYNILDYLVKGDVLVVNESKVSRCRLIGVKEKTGASIECFVLNKAEDNNHLVLLKPAKRLKTGDKVYIGDYHFTLRSKLDYGKALVEFNTPAEVIFKKHGIIPLPPYIKSKDVERSRYQTVYAKKEGSSAAPTAGLHFSKKLMEKIDSMGVVLARVGLEVGLDTFRPILSEEIEEHKMHSENYYIKDTEAEKITTSKSMETGEPLIFIYIPAMILRSWTG